MRLSKLGADLIKHYEGYELEPYICPAGYWTIGWGHRISDAERFRLTAGISITEAQQLFDYDIARFERGVLRLITWPTTQGQFDALVSFSFNLGLGRLQASTLRAKFNRGEYAGDELPKWVFSKGIKLAGLVKRRYAEKALFDA
jgi:lysozyme